MAVNVSDPPPSAVATPVRFTFDDYVRYTDTPRSMPATSSCATGSFCAWVCS
jgi:hypothetical protein